MGIEKRKHPRYAVRLELQIRGLRLYTNNISEAGFQCSCPGMLMDLLKPGSATSTLDTTINLPDGDELRCAARVVYVTEYGDEHLIGAQITEFEADGGAALAAFVRSLAGRRPAR